MNIPQRHEIVFREKHEVANNTVIFIFEKPEGFSFRAGQFATLRIPSVMEIGAPQDAVRALSFASAPSDDHVAFAWRRSDSLFKKAADALAPGDTIEMIAPAGHATLPEEGPVVFLVGGIGSTPVRSIMREVRAQGLTRDLTLLYSNRVPEDTPFFAEMVDAPDFRIVHTMTDAQAEWSGETGFITADMVKRHVPHFADATYYLVGTGGFIRAMEGVVAELGVGHDRIVCDNFGG